MFWQPFVTKPLPQTVFCIWNQVKPLIWVSAGTCIILQQLLLSEEGCIPGFPLNVATSDNVRVNRFFKQERLLGNEEMTDSGGSVLNSCSNHDVSSCSVLQDRHYIFLEGIRSVAQIITNLPVC